MHVYRVDMNIPASSGIPHKKASSAGAAAASRSPSNPTPVRDSGRVNVRVWGSGAALAAPHLLATGLELGLDISSIY